MAVQHRLVRCRPDRVWEVLEDGSRYADWVVGTHDSWEDDERWPQEGAALRYRIKIGPWAYEGRTIVRAYEPPHRLELEAMAGRRVSARIAIEVRPWGEYTLIILDEHPLRGRGNNFHHAAIDAVAQVRHRAMLARFARVVEPEDPGPESTGPRSTGTRGREGRRGLRARGHPARGHSARGHPA